MQARPLQKPVGNLEPPDLCAHPIWRTAREIAHILTDADVSVPFFSLPTLSSALNIGVNLFGGDLLTAMVTAPEAAKRNLRIINGTIIDLHRWYRENLPKAQLHQVVGAGRAQPAGFGQLCGCSTHLLSSVMYEEFIAPLDDALLSNYPHGGMIHLCGSHAQHIPVWRSMHSLRSVQLNDHAAVDLELYFDGLRQDQIVYVNPCGQMPVERIMEITGGHRVVIVANLKEAPRQRRDKH